MEKEKIIQSIQQLFEGTDERNWQKVQRTMADSVLLDYTSMAGGKPATLSPTQITDAWAALLPGFDRTHHQLSDYQVSINESRAFVHYTGKADHYMGQEVWIVEGNYETELEKQKNQWLVTKQKFTLQKQSGNTHLQAKAQEIVAKKKLKK
jgi:hypothetical protein